MHKKRGLTLHQLRTQQRQAQDRLVEAGLDLSASLNAALRTLGFADENDAPNQPDCEEESWGKLKVRFAAPVRWSGGTSSIRRPRARFTTEASAVTCIVPMPNSVVAGHANGNVFIWDTTGFAAVPLHQFEAHHVPIGSITILSQVDCIVTASAGRDRAECIGDSTVRLWSRSTLELQQTLPLHGAAARSMRQVSVTREDPINCLVLACNSRNTNQLQLLKSCAS